MPDALGYRAKIGGRRSPLIPRPHEIKMLISNNEKRVAVSVAAAAQQVYRMASAHGLGRKDCAAVYRFLAPSPDEPG
jgi:hypothetical protein